MIKCDHCPVGHLAVTCHAHVTRHARFCQLAETRCDYRRLIYEQSAREPAPFVCPDDVPYVAPTPQQPVAVPLATSIAVTKCPHRTREPNCGCLGKWRCERDQRDVTWPECVACKTAEADPSP